MGVTIDLIFNQIRSALAENFANITLAGKQTKAKVLGSAHKQHREIMQQSQSKPNNRKIKQ